MRKSFRMATVVGPAIHWAVTFVGLLGATTFNTTPSKGRGDDFVQDYVSARAWRHGADPYGDLVKLRVTAGLPFYDAVPINPHPPAAWLIVLPLTFFSFPTSLALLKLINLGCLSFVWQLATRDWFLGKATRGWRIGRWPADLAGGALLGSWAPVYQGYDWGQPVGILAVLVAATVWLARNNRAIAAGVVTGLAVGIRPFLFCLVASWVAWPRRVGFKAFAAAVATTCAIFASAGVWPWKWAQAALSVQHFAHTMRSLPILLGFELDAALVATVCVFLIGFWAASNASAEVSLTLCLSLILTVYPLAWFHYDVCLIPLVIRLYGSWIADDSRAATAGRFLLFGYFLLRMPPTVHDAPAIQLWLQAIARLFAACAALIAIRCGARETQPIPIGRCSQPPD
jgi:hypothetical protein